MASNGIAWTDKSLFKNLDAAPAKLDAAMVAFTNYWAPQVASYARSNAPWQDQTSNARNGLTAVAENSPSNHAIVLFHRMPYGIWLEVRWSGRYAIILPTVKVMGHTVMAGARDLMRRMS